jgi:peptidoglycan/LPS O-acetylase OafA/YrhL
MMMIARQDIGHDRLPGLDLLRLVAALAVVAFHWLYRGAVGDGPLETLFPEVAPIAEFGYLGVNLFFLISGYVISRTVEGRDVGSFFVARVARLYPGHLACMTLTFIVLLLAADPAMPTSIAQWAANLTMVAPAFGQPFMDGVYWSIVVELAFYAWVALFVGVGLFDRHVPQIALAWLAVCAANELWLQNGALRLAFVTDYGPLFIFGMMMREWREKERSRQAVILMAAAFLLSCNQLTLTQQWMLHAYGRAVATPALIVANVAIHLALIAALRYGNRLGRWRLWAEIGALTYPIYLLHANIGYVVIDSLTPVVGRWPSIFLCGLLILLCSAVIWRLVERPCGRLIRQAGSRAMAWIVGRAEAQTKGAP